MSRFFAVAFVLLVLAGCSPMRAPCHTAGEDYTSADACS
jgi:hypothetical protein